MNTKPEMSRQEASWHEHIAGIRAEEKARAEGGDTAAIAAIANATVGPVTIAGHTLAPASQGTVWTLQRLARDFQAYADTNGLATPEAMASPTNQLVQLGLTLLVFLNPRAVWRDLETGKLADLIARADDMMWSMPLTDQVALQSHFRAQMAAINALAPEEDLPGKSLTEDPSSITSGTSPETPTPQPVRDSPPSSGSVLNTALPSPLPSGIYP